MGQSSGSLPLITLNYKFTDHETNDIINYEVNIKVSERADIHNRDQWPHAVEEERKMTDKAVNP